MNHKGQLQEYAMKHKIPLPEYLAPRRSANDAWVSTVKFNGREFRGEDVQKTGSQHMAALAALDHIRSETDSRTRKINFKTPEKEKEKEKDEPLYAVEFHTSDPKVIEAGTEYWIAVVGVNDGLIRRPKENDQIKDWFTTMVVELMQRNHHSTVTVGSKKFRLTPLT